MLGKISESPSLSEVEELLRVGVDPSVRNENGETPLDIAEELGLVKIIEELKARTAV